MVGPPPVPKRMIQKKTPTLPSKKPTTKVATSPSDQSCLRRNWCWILRIVLALVGLGIPLYMMFLMPCEGETTFVKQPVDMFVILDASGSVSDIDWQRSTQSASEWIKVFDEQNPENMQVGVSQFSDSSTLNSQFHPDVSVSLSALEGLERDHVGGTAYVPALQLLQSSLNSHRVSGSFAMALFISDGEPNESYNQIISIVDELKADNVTMVGVMIGNSNSAAQTMFEISSCELYDMERCPNFIFMDNFEEFQQDSQELANSVALQVGLTEEVSCEPGIWWLSLLLILPLLLLLCAPCCVNKKKKKLKRKYKAPDAENPLPKVAPPALPQRPKGKKKYKWDVKNADHYLWNFQGGTTPMAVDYGTKAPPSAPKDLSQGKFKRKAEVWEEADGFCYEYEVEELTLEEWAEEAFDEATKNGLSGLLASCCCCCCCCCKKSSNTTN